MLTDKCHRRCSHKTFQRLVLAVFQRKGKRCRRRGCRSFITRPISASVQSRWCIGASVAYSGYLRGFTCPSCWQVLSESQRRKPHLISIAGLVNFGDYVIGYPGGVLRGEGDFFNLVEEHTDRPLRLFVYNADFDVTREVVIGMAFSFQNCHNYGLRLKMFTKSGNSTEPRLGQRRQLAWVRRRLWSSASNT